MYFTETDKIEVWQRGALKDIPLLLQPIAHTLLQVKEELHELMIEFPDNLLWQKPAGLASPSFHLQHLSGVLDRVFTYARNEKLNIDQLKQLQLEDELFIPEFTVTQLLARFNFQVYKALLQLNTTDESTLTEARGIGRKLIPSTVIGLLVHAAEHTMRHFGQLLVTVKVIKAATFLA